MRWEDIAEPVWFQPILKQLKAQEHCQYYLMKCFLTWKGCFWFLDCSSGLILSLSTTDSCRKGTIKKRKRIKNLYYVFWDFFVIIHNWLCFLIFGRQKSILCVFVNKMICHILLCFLKMFLFCIKCSGFVLWLQTVSWLKELFFDLISGIPNVLAKVCVYYVLGLFCVFILSCVITVVITCNSTLCSLKKPFLVFGMV